MMQSCTKNGDQDIDFKMDLIRESLRRAFPKWVQGFVTEMTGKPYYGEKEWHRTPMFYLVSALSVMVIGIGVGIVSVVTQNIFIVLPFCWIAVTHGLRKMYLTVQHACAHQTLTRKHDFIIGEISSIMTITGHFDQYRHNHLRMHHSSHLLTDGDPTFDYLINYIGFQCGQNVEQLWKHLWNLLFSPRHHVRAFKKRLITTFFSPDKKHNILAWIFWGSILIMLEMMGTLVPFLIVVLPCVTIFFEIATILRACVEHHWPRNGVSGNKEVLDEMTSAIFLGEAVPELSRDACFLQKVTAWSQWALKMVFYHYLARIIVLTGDSVCHDYHHKIPSSAKEWTNYIFGREKVAANNPSFEASWGMVSAINKTFESISRAAT